MNWVCLVLGHRWRRMRGGYRNRQQCERCRTYRWADER
jgi:hypothetical protein